MTTAELLATLARECPNGVSFDPMAVRLLRHKAPFEASQIEDLKAAMFQLGSGLWFSSEMISDEESRLTFCEQATVWLTEHACFSVERIFRSFSSVLHHIATPKDCTAFLKHLGFTVAMWGKGGYFCSLPTTSLDDSLMAISKTIAELLEEADGILPFHEIEQAMPHLTIEAIENIRVHFLPEVHEEKIGGVPCWRSADAISLPEDFSERLTTIVDTLVALDEKVSAANLEFALNLFYGIRLREEYALLDNDAFIRVCEKHYQGEDYIFPNKNKSRVKENGSFLPGRRVRSPSRFHNLGVPIGAELTFSKDGHITCTVLDDINKVGYDGKAWSISALAVHLLGVSAANGFYHFSYNGELLWDRRLRLEGPGKETVYRSVEKSLHVEVQETESEVIGLEGRVLSPRTWRSFRRDGTNPHVAEWARRVENGESVENIAREYGLMASTVKEYIMNRRRYLEVCKKNGIVPEGGMDV